ncbi:unnamed protein product [Polarella glacialis]|uniref:Beta-lactamase-related domain-containing protein n=1 Tax=Polarella glacialis TaxID=89957 RepID=A0A813KGX0_POLGL|nr:unnamed protein product [Polarella glacialis]
MDEKEREASAKWVIATLSQDRLLYLSSLIKLGFEFGMDADTPEFVAFLEASLGSSAWMFRDSIPSSSQMNFLEQLKQHNQRAAEHEDFDQQGKQLVGKIPGVVYFFMRGLDMLQNICGLLDVSVPFSGIMLQSCMQVLQADGYWTPSRALPAPKDAPKQTALALALRAKLQELDDAGLVLGAQVAVLAGMPGEEGDWLCKISCGRMGTCFGAPVTDQMLMPMLGASPGPLLLCLLAALCHVTAAGQQVSLDTPVAQLWPDFAQRGKASVTIGQLLKHEGGLAKPFPSDLTTRGFCSEWRMEEVIAAAPFESEGDWLSPVLGAVVASLLRRMNGRKSAQDALAAALERLGLQEDIAYCRASRPDGKAKVAAHAGRVPRKSVPMEQMFEWLEEKMENLDAIAENPDRVRRRWLSWWGLAAERPGSADPLLINRKALLDGESCLPGRGLRANAQSLCRLFGAGLVPQEFMEQCAAPARQVAITSKQEWREVSGCPDVAAGGLQLFKFRNRGGNGQVMAYGYADGSTGSVVLRLPSCSVAILLSNAANNTRHVGHTLLSIVAAHVGLELDWPAEPPRHLPQKIGGLPEAAAAPTSASAKQSAGAAYNFNNNNSNKDNNNNDFSSAASLKSAGPAGGGRSAEELELQRKLAEMEAKVATLTQVLNATPPPDATPSSVASEVQRQASPVLPQVVQPSPQQQQPQAQTRSLAGIWNSAETEGLDTLLEALQVPQMMRSMAGAASRKLEVKIVGDKVALRSTTTVMGNEVEETLTEFTVGEQFEGEQAMGGYYVGEAYWAPDAENRNLQLEKRFMMDEKEILFEEDYVMKTNDRLAMTTTLTGQLQLGERRIEVHRPLAFA